MKVILLAHTPMPEQVCASAAKLCYSKAKASEISSGFTKEKTESFLKMLAEIGHESPTEHASFTFAIEGVSRSLLAQITRHRIASYSVKSQRYVKEGQFEFVLPPEIENIPEAKEIFLKAMEEDQRTYNHLTDILFNKHKDALLKDGMDEAEAAKKAEKMAIEDARFVLPNACSTQMIVTMNARNLKHFFAQRCCERAQWEIRELAYLMLCEVKKVAPLLFTKAGPPCVSGACPEGKMSCGKAKEIRAKYLEL